MCTLLEELQKYKRNTYNGHIIIVEETNTEEKKKGEEEQDMLHAGTSPKPRYPILVSTPLPCLQIPKQVEGKSCKAAVSDLRPNPKMQKESPEYAKTSHMVKCCSLEKVSSMCMWRQAAAGRHTKQR